MKTRTKYSPQLLLIFLLATMLTACGSRTKFVAPEIEPPADLIPGYVPEGFKLVSGFQLTGKFTLPVFSNGDEGGLFGHLREGYAFFNVKSPSGNDIQGLYYQGKEDLILIARSYFPDGTLDLWRNAYETAQPKSCECVWAGLPRLGAEPFPVRFHEIQEMRTVGETQVAVLDGPLGLITVFVRGDYLLTVESGISLEENLKIVASLLEN